MDQSSDLLTYAVMQVSNHVYSKQSTSRIKNKLLPTCTDINFQTNNNTL